MNNQTRYARRCRGSPLLARNLQHGSLLGSVTGRAWIRKRESAELAPKPARIVLTTTMTSAALLVGPLCWRLTHNLTLSLGVVLILAASTAIATWLLAREQTQQVKARERGATDREQIRHRGETLLAEAQQLALKAAACGPNSSPADAQALRADARKALQLIQPTSVKDAMQITRLRRPGIALEPNEHQVTVWDPEEAVGPDGPRRI